MRKCRASLDVRLRPALADSRGFPLRGGHEPTAVLCRRLRDSSRCSLRRCPRSGRCIQQLVLLAPRAGESGSMRQPRALPTESPICPVSGRLSEPASARSSSGLTCRRSALYQPVLEHRCRARRRSSASHVGLRAAEPAHRRSQQRQSRCPLPADRPHTAPQSPAATEDDPDANAVADSVPSQRRHPSDLHGRSLVAGQRPTTVAVGLSSVVGRRHARCRDVRPQGRRVARRQRCAAHQCRTR